VDGGKPISSGRNRAFARQPARSLDTDADVFDFFENGAVALHLVGPDGTILKANKAELALLGYAAHEYVGRNIAEFHVDPETIADILATLSRGEAIDKRAARLRARDGTIKHVLITSSVNFKDGDFVNTRCFTLDVTEKKLAEDLLRQQEQRLTTTYNHAGIGIAEVDETGRHVRVNNALCDIAGYSPEEMLHRTFFDNTHPDDRGRDRELYAKMVSHGLDRYSLEKRYIRQDGETVWVNIDASCVRDSDGRFLYGVRIIQDIAEQRRAREARQRLASIVESSDDAIISKDLNGILVTWNEAAERLFGYTAEEAIGRPVTMLIPEDRQGEEPEIMSRIRRGERIDHYETIRRRKDGTLIDMSLTVSPIKNDMGRVIGASKIGRDISERKRAEQQRELLLAELSHRVKNTLATVLSVAQQSFSKAASLEEARDAFTGRIRALAHTHTRLAETSWNGVSLHALVADELAPYSGEDGTHARLSGPEIELDPKRAVMLGMAFHELATNAAKHGALSSSSGSVEIGWTIEPGQLLVIRWLERGGPPVAAPKRSGFGTFLLRRVLPADLGASLTPEYNESGLRCEIIVPLSNRLTDPV
jgi:PAS domain S-box-containing protein